MPDATPIADKLSQSLQRLMAEADRRADQFRPGLDAAPALGPCEKCGDHLVDLDEESSLEESVARNTLRIVYGVCDNCQTEARQQEKLARHGVPRRVRHATFANYEIYAPAKQGPAVEAVRGWCDDRQRWLLTLLGSTGAGKGHLASAAIRQIGASARWTTHPDLVNEYHGIEFSQRRDYIRRFRHVPILVIDEMGTKAATADTGELFFGILNLRHEEGLDTILIGNIPLKPRREGDGKISILGLIGDDRMESRMVRYATVVSCKWEDYRRRE